MIFKKDYGTLVQKSLQQLVTRSAITNQTVGGIARSIIEVVNLNVAEYYDILDINTAMGFVSTSEGYFLDLIGTGLFNLSRQQATSSSAVSTDSVQQFYVSTGYLSTYIPSLQIVQGTTVSSADGTIVFTVPSNTSFGPTDTSVYVPIVANGTGTNYNVPINTLVVSSLGLANVFTTNVSITSGGSNIETDDNYKYRIANATLSAAMANETAVRLAALSVPGVSNVIMQPYANGIGTFSVIVLPTSGLATAGLISAVQSAINTVQAFGITGTAIAPEVVPVSITVDLQFVQGTTSATQSNVQAEVQTSIENYIVNIPIGGTFVLDQLTAAIINTDPSVMDYMITSYMFNQQNTFQGNVSIYWDQIFYPDTSLASPITVT